MQKDLSVLLICFVILTWAALDTRGPEVVFSVWVRYQLVEVGVVTQEARAGVLTHPVILEIPTGLQHKQPSSSTLGPKHSNDNTAFLYRGLGLILRAAERSGRADADTPGSAKRKI